jgi:hypothetical protein
MINKSALDLESVTIAVVEMADGQRVAVPLIPIPEDAPSDLREGLARRNVVNASGRCPCGAHWELPTELDPSGLTAVDVVHENDCPATDSVLLPLVDEWLA